MRRVAASGIEPSPANRPLSSQGSAVPRSFQDGRPRLPACRQVFRRTSTLPLPASTYGIGAACGYRDVDVPPPTQGGRLPGQAHPARSCRLPGRQRLDVQGRELPAARFARELSRVAGPLTSSGGLAGRPPRPDTVLLGQGRSTMLREGLSSGICCTSLRLIGAPLRNLLYIVRCFTSWHLALDRPVYRYLARGRTSSLTAPRATGSASASHSN